jgi:hypothetical protein
MLAGSPEAQVIDTIRALLAGTPVGSHALLGSPRA